MKKITLLVALLFCGATFSQTLLLDGGTSGTALWDETFGQGATYQNPLPIVNHTNTVDSEGVVLIEKSTNGTAVWHLIGCRKDGDTNAGVNIDATNHFIQLKFRTNKDSNGSISIQPFEQTEVSANYVGDGGGTGTTTFGAWQTLIFDLSADNGVFLNRLDIRIDGAETYTSAFQFEIDDVLFGDNTLSNTEFVKTNISNKIYSSNPVTSLIEGNLERGPYSIVNVLGAKVDSGVFTGSINVERLKSGVYILALNEGFYRFVKK